MKHEIKIFIYPMIQKCSNINTCVCDPGWSGIDCSMPVMWQTTPPTFAPPRPTQAQQGATPVDEGPTQSHTHVCKYCLQ